MPAATSVESVSARFAAQVRAAPDHPAVRVGSRMLTYAGLDDLAARMSAMLRAKGTPVGEPVAILMHHDAPLLAAILGVIRAGAVSMCLDRGQPPARLVETLDDAQPSWILTDEIGTDPARVGRFSERLLDVLALPDRVWQDEAALAGAGADGALLFYTSGSTGRPKGVLQSHRAALHGARSYGAMLDLAPGDRLALMHACTVDASRAMSFGGLLNGATVCMFDLRREGVHAAAAWMAREGVSICHMVPSVFRVFASGLSGPEALPALRAVKLGGEAVTIADVELFRQKFSSPCVLVNGLGATEIGGGNACYFVIDRTTAIEGPLVPIGRPADGMDVRLLDEDGRRLGPGETGEIVVRSEYLSSGYWRDAESTARVFAPLEAGDRVPAFRTGDLGRCDADGRITHLGRRDQRVKVRGHRIEILEIEAHLGAIDGVAAAAVAAGRDASGAVRLTAFVVPGAAGAATAAVRRALALRLPDYMIPSAFVPLTALPSLPGGKTDRATLERWADARIAAPAAGAAAPPVDLLQDRLTRIWEQVLGVASIGPHDGFFDLGGHSLGAAEVCSAVERTFGIRLPLVAFAEASTITQLATAIRSRGWSERWPPLVALQPRGTRPALYCVPGAGGDVMSLRALASHLGRDQPLYGLQPRGADGVEGFDPTLDRIAARFVDAIRAHQPRGPYFLAGSSFGGTVAFEMTRQLEAAGERVALLALLDAYGPGYPLPSTTAPFRPGMFLLAPFRWCLPRHLFNLLAESCLGGFLGRRQARDFLRAAVRYWRARFYIALPQFVARPFHLRFECLQAAAFRAGGRYVARPIAGRIDLFRTARQPGAALYEDDHELGWRGFAAGGVRVRVVPGMHSEHIQEPHVRVLAAELTEALAEARGAST